MGWKGTLRNINAAGNRAARESERKEKAVSRAYSRIDRNYEQVVSKATSLENRLERDPIKALDLSYSRGVGFRSSPFEISTDLFSGTVSLTSSDSDGSTTFSPPVAENEFFSITPLDMLFTRWGTIIAIEIENRDSYNRIRTTWHKKTDPADSKIFILDPQSGSYYYPTSSQSSGETLSGHPRIILFSFPCFSKPASKIELHISNVKLTTERARKYTFTFTYSDETLPDAIQRANSNPSLVSEIRSVLDVETQKLQDQVKRSGCSIALLIGWSAIAAATYYGIELMA